jgi:hypothetical protein
LILQVVDGSQNIIKQPIPNWIVTSLILLRSQRSLAQQAIQAFACKQNIQLEFASLIAARYLGNIVMLDRYYGLQLVENKLIAHDISIVKLPDPSLSVIEISYNNGPVTVCYDPQNQGFLQN